MNSDQDLTENKEKINNILIQHNIIFNIIVVGVTEYKYGHKE
jgi:hypothetical protein